MTAVKHDIPERLERMLKAAGSQAELARRGNVSPGTLINWLRGFGFHDSTMEEFAKSCGVDFEWLKDGSGQDAEQIRRFKDRLAEADVDSSRIAEDSMHSHSQTPARGPYSVIEKTAARLSPQGIAETIADILQDDSSPLMDRLAASERMAMVLAKRLALERKRHET